MFPITLWEPEIWANLRLNPGFATVIAEGLKKKISVELVKETLKMCPGFPGRQLVINNQENGIK